MPKKLTVNEMVGDYVRLEPLSVAHASDLAVAGNEDRSTYGFTNVGKNYDDVLADIEGLLADHERGDVVPFAQVAVSTGRAIGQTRYLTIRRKLGHDVPFAVEIGGTWLASSVQRTGINTEAKLLLLTYAFDVWGVGRVDLKTDARNERSRAAIARIGATYEGVLRH